MSGPDTEPSAKITLNTIYQLLIEMKHATDPLPKKVEDHEVRIRAIEKYLWVWIGAAGTAGAGLSQAAGALLNK